MAVVSFPPPAASAAAVYFSTPSASSTSSLSQGSSFSAAQPCPGLTSPVTSVASSSSMQPFAGSSPQPFRKSVSTSNATTSSTNTFQACQCTSSNSTFFPPSGAVEVIAGRLYWVTLASVPPPFLCSKADRRSFVHYFSIDDHLRYEPFYADFGPLNLALTYRYCKLVESKLSNQALAGMKIVHYCSQDTCKRTNAAYLMCAFQVIALKRSADKAHALFSTFYPPFPPFRDATYGACTYNLLLLDCLKGTELAMKLNWFKYETFDVEEYEYFEKVENGDINWIIPKHFLAFSAPAKDSSDAEGLPSFTPEDYVPVFKSLNVQLIVRLNKRQYNRDRFVQHGFAHEDMYFVDGSCPPKHIVHRFLHVTQRQNGAIAVHCKAGLGRTGTLIGSYAIKNYRFPAAYWIGWNRICRPGSILGPQQHFLIEMQSELMQLGMSEGQIQRAPMELTYDAELTERLGHMSLEERRKAEQGDQGQGDRLVHVKRHHPAPNTFSEALLYPPQATATTIISKRSTPIPFTKASKITSSRFRREQ